MKEKTSKATKIIIFTPKVNEVESMSTKHKCYTHYSEGLLGLLALIKTVITSRS